jgi:hypothetical protein
MAQKFNIQKIGNTTVVKSFDDARPNVVSTKNYNQSFDIDLQSDGKFIVSKNEKPVLSFLFSQIDNPGDAETPEEYMEFLATSFFFVSLNSGGGGGANLLFPVFHQKYDGVNNIFTLPEDAISIVSVVSEQTTIFAFTYNAETKEVDINQAWIYEDDNIYITYTKLAE